MTIFATVDKITQLTGINIFIIIILAVLMENYREERKSCNNRVAIRYSNKALREVGILTGVVCGEGILPVTIV